MNVRSQLRKGLVIPAHPLALNAERKLDERRQRALTRYYLASGAGGVAVGVHTTQFAIRNPQCGLFRPVLEIAAEELLKREVVKIAGVCGQRTQAMAEVELAAGLRYDAVLLSLGAMADATITELVEHVRTVASVLPVIGFYLQPAVGGRSLPFSFWSAVAEIQNVVAIKIAPFNRYQTIDVLRAVAASGRASEIALYTGNDDSILVDLLSPFSTGTQTVRIVGGLLGHWAVWTSVAVQQLQAVQELATSGESIPSYMLQLAWQITDANAALFDPAHQFHGCIPGIHEVLRRQGLLEGRWCLNQSEELSPGQMDEIDRVWNAYPHLRDDSFVAEHLQEWLS